MPEICPTCGLPKEICACEEIAQEQQRIRVFNQKRTFGKSVTIIKGLAEEEVDMEDIASDLKKNLACGGTVKEGHIELQGNHKSNVKDLLVDMGFSSEMIEVE
ncbi:translation initiation factor Sui1 [candidate division MSBL1 archaeon SCGC-AAA259I09]|uniref:Protein translation factor SUI1 homolog n=2 Tax=candidate division MSBL1 TaxID=215777 RepID=A0A133UQ27_9EURY|nr:translation initiation factor Sui1 [candidate division MSBL1 archaeon SCGC-AAA259D14]KXA96344.1 translation initiation factor Sui1 [candidate division MSBL1 archaeon SCGC-AAA259I09]